MKTQALPPQLQKALDDELLKEALSRISDERREDVEQPYYTTTEGSTRYIYGPFASKRDAAKVSYFTRPREEGELAHREDRSPNYMLRNWSEMTGNEIQYAIDTPNLEDRHSPIERTSVNPKNRKPHVHPSFHPSMGSQVPPANYGHWFDELFPEYWE